MRNPEFTKNPDGLLPCIVQHFKTRQVLMLGYMNRNAYEKTLTEGLVTFYSRSKQRLWTKGESSGNYLTVKEVLIDCDGDTILIVAQPSGPVCHTGSDTCFGEEVLTNSGFLTELESIITHRKNTPAEGSYTASLFQKGINAIAQKVGEEAVELIIEAKDTDDQKFLNEAADLLFHYLVLLQAKGFTLMDVEKLLEARHGK
ncbi:histidine biosynthesis bifunctional protein HisIE [Thermaurantimonas aggregans]|uniref:Histidine biosynthesis bifunctional protein HisIE n=1 Tax=Thermaurantimonas aggregans TaxID=2173829 RepID=A0A401XJS7_9FLAO|nr:bifunctional phosphoribosyl-AMP cyclohydrolase/phosphoribosyl-ATP diphosphatase HisIE [Thermaurantimonas aggregans]MCX8149257.1 bifunctional phosphoribosyl-AMP cyclohydrolase/phosphoribosyl-ATP diphosphatase HisIE [Thermaurantimonas aggregans]GCD77240.1 histidine biosynthesis bifunctional protein HisIE [Thermaurantimonas aggregans]